MLELSIQNQSQCNIFMEALMKFLMIGMMEFLLFGSDTLHLMFRNTQLKTDDGLYLTVLSMLFGLKT